MIQSLVGDRSLSEGLRRAGLAVVAEERSLQVLANGKKRQQANELHVAAMGVVSRAGASPDAIAKALEESRQACELAPNDLHSLCILSFALYRADKFEEALATVKKSDDLSGSHVTRSIDVSNWAVRAMAQFKLGRIDEAKQSLARAHEISGRPMISSEEALWLI